MDEMVIYGFQHIQCLLWWGAGLMTEFFQQKKQILEKAYNEDWKCDQVNSWSSIKLRSSCL